MSFIRTNVMNNLRLDITQSVLSNSLCFRKNLNGTFSG